MILREIHKQKLVYSIVFCTFPFHFLISLKMKILRFKKILRLVKDSFVVLNFNHPAISLDHDRFGRWRNLITT